MILLINTIIYVIFTYVVWKKNGKGVNMPFLLWGTYTFFYILAYVLVQNASIVYRLFSIVFVRLDTPLKVDGLVYMFICLLILSIPILTFKEGKMAKIISPNPTSFKIFVVVYIILGFFSMIVNYNLVLQNMSRGLSFDEIKDLSFSGELSDMPVYHIYIKTLFSGLECTGLIMLFYLFVKRKEHPKLLLLLVFSCTFLSPFFDAIGNASRGGFYFIFCNYVLCIVLFRNFLSRKIKKNLTLVCVIFLCSMLIFITLITSSRFDGGGGSSSLYSLLLYFGQPFLNFNQMIYGEIASNALLDGRMSFEYIYRLIEGGESLVITDSVQQWSNKLGFFADLFYTSIGNFYMDFGEVGAIVMCIIFSFIGYNVLKGTTKIVSFHQLIFYFFYFQLCFQGIFNFTYGRNTGNIKLIITLLCYFFFRLTFSKKRIM